MTWTQTSRLRGMRRVVAFAGGGIVCLAVTAAQSNSQIAAPNPADTATKTCVSPMVASGPGGDFSFGGSTIRSSVDESNGTASLRATYHPGSTPCVTPRWRTVATARFEYGEKARDNEPVVLTRAIRGELQQLRHLGGDRFSVAGTVRARHSSAQGLDLEQAYLLTGGTRIRSLGGLEVSLGPTWSWLRMKDVPAEYSLGYVAAETGSLSFAIGSGTLLVTQGARYFGTFATTRRARFEAVVIIFAPLSPHLGIDWTAWFDHLENAPPGFRSDYVSNSISIKITF